MKTRKSFILSLAALMVVGLFAGCWYDQEEDDTTGPAGQGAQGPRLTLSVQPRYVPANGTATAVVMARVLNLEDGTGIPDQEVLLRIENIAPEFLQFADATDTTTVWTDGAGLAFATVYAGTFDPWDPYGADGITAQIRGDTVLRYFDDWTELTEWTDITVYDPNYDG